MMDIGKFAIPRFDPHSDPATLGPRWTRWLSSFEIYADGKGLILSDGVADTVKQRRRAQLLHLAGPEVQEIFETLADKGTVIEYDKAKTALDTFFVPKVNTAFARHKFRQLIQKTGESILHFVTRLRTEAKDCGFGLDKDNQIRDAVLSGCTSVYIRRKLLEEGAELTLERTLTIAEHYEKIDSQLGSFPGQEAAASKETVNRVSEQPRPKPKWEKWDKSNTKGKPACYRCGTVGHYGRDPKCPAKGTTCNKCNKPDHFAKVCKTKPAVNLVEDGGPNPHYAFTVIDRYHKSNMLTVCVGGVDLKMLVDSGATSNIVDKGTWEKLKSEGIKCESHANSGGSKKLYTYSAETPLQVKGSFTCVATVGKGKTQAEFIVIDGNGMPLLGKNTAIELGVLKIGVDVAAITGMGEDLERQYPEVFHGIGKLKGREITLHVDPSVEPVAQRLRRTPFNLREKVENKTQELLDADIIEQVEGPTPWVNPIVVVPKSGGDIRLCVDMRRANEAIIRGHYPIPTVDELLQNMNGSEVFSKLDLKWGYHQLELSVESRGITTFVTHTGLFRYKRLLFGICSASEQYQYEIQTALAGISGVENISDDIIIHGDNKQIHDERLHAVIKRLRECRLTLNRDKCQFNMDKLVFMGILLSHKGIGPTEDRVKAVMEARQPENDAEVRSFLGLVSYSSRFIPQFATLSEPLRKLTRKDVPFDFGSEQRKAFKGLKESLARAITLAYFKKGAHTQVIADASPVGLGAVLVQKQKLNEGWVPVCYASRSLTSCERRYSQTEREALGLVWACERFHAYIYGMKFDLVTDHKPLEAIYSPRSKPCARIERWVLRLQPYQFKVVYIPGPKNIADSLSRLLSDTAGTQVHDHGAEEYVRFVAINATPKALTSREVEEASAVDEELGEVRAAIQTGHFEACKAYMPIAGELCTLGQLVLRGTRIILPNKLRPRALSLAHEGHLGIVGTKQNLRSKVWWPGMEKAAEKHCRSCHGCQLVARPDPPEPLRPTRLPQGPWMDVATDLLGPLDSGHSILVTVDYYSRYYEYAILKSTTAEKVIDCLDEMFSRHGLPETLKSDNGPQFRSEEFKTFCELNGIMPLKVTAKWPQANGEVERQNDSLLKRIRIAQAEGLNWKKELRKYVAKYRGIDHNTTGRSPAELLFNRKVRGKLPDISSGHRENLEVQDRDAEQKGKSKIYTDERRNAKYSDVQVGDEVLVRQNKTNKLDTNFNATPHTVVSKAGNSLVVQSPAGVRYSRNTTHVKQYIQPEAPLVPELINPEVVSQPVNDVAGGSQEALPMPQTPKVTPVPLTPVARPQRTRQTPARFADFVLA